MAKPTRTQILADNVSGNGQTTGVDISSQGGRMIIVSGTGTAQIQVESSTGDWVNIVDGNFTEASAKYMQSVLSGLTLRVDYTGATDLTVEVTS